MEDNKLLAELRAQRELIRKHLKWLDQQIGDIPTDTDGSDDNAVDGKEPTRDTPEATDATEALGVAPKVEAEAAEHEANDEAEHWFSSYKAPSGDDVLKAKTGCFVLFALGTLFFLFLLFGLPYLMN